MISLHFQYVTIALELAIKEKELRLEAASSREEQVEATRVAQKRKKGSEHRPEEEKADDSKASRCL